MNVHVLLYCRTEEDVKGNTLFFDTVRVGFPDATIHVWDNANQDAYRNRFKSDSNAVNCEHHNIEREILHSDWIKHLVDVEKQPFYIIDPDTIWYDKMPERFDAAIAGRVIPEFFDHYTGCFTFERIHTSCIYIDPLVVQNAMDVEGKFAFDWASDDMIPDPDQKGEWLRFDTCAKLYHAMPTKLIHKFTDEENSKFAQLFCGTHQSIIKNYYKELADVWDTVGNRDFRNLYKEQHKFFTTR